VTEPRKDPVDEPPHGETFSEARARTRAGREAEATPEKPPAGIAADGLSWHAIPKPMALHGHTVLVLAQSTALALVIHAEEWELMANGNIPITALHVARVDQLQEAK
jgi:hypothetical protein